MKQFYQVVIVGLVAFSCIDSGMCFAAGDTQNTSVPGTQASLPSESAEQQDEDDATQAEKVKKTISNVPHKTGNLFLKGFDTVGNFIENHTGHHFETKWSTPPSDAETMPSDRGMVRRDPAQGT